MTDAHLMDADCVHGRTWWECEVCASDAPAEDEQHQGDDREDDEDGPEHDGEVPPT